MNSFIDRLAEFLRSILGSDDQPSAGAGQQSRRTSVDPDLQDAWDELNDYMNAGREGDQAGPGSAGRGGAGGRGGTGTRRRPPDESLRQDYANLEVPFGADMDTVRRSYKSLILRYHPDKHGRNPEEQRVALEITKKINESFERIRASQESRTGSS